MERLRRIKAHLSLWWRASRSLSLLRLLLALCSPVIFYLAIMAQADLITALTRGTTWQEAWPKLLWVIATMLATPLMGFLATIVDAHLQLRYTVLFQTMLAEAALHPHGIERLENPDSTAELKSLTTESRQWYSLNNIQLTMAIFGSRLNGIVAFFIVTRWNLWAALAVTAAILLASHSFMRYLKQIIDRWMSTSKEGRQSAEYSRKITTNREAGKEVRLFDLTNFAINRYTHGHLDSLRQEWRTRSKNFWPTLASNVVYLVIFATAVTMLILQAFDGVIAVGAMFAIFQGLEGISSLGPQGDAQIHVTRAEGYASSLLAIREKAGLARIPQRRSDEFVLPPPPLRGAADISLTNVSFTYPSREDPVFQGLSLDIPAGQHIAIVGVNGAGKSTLIKLLTGLYAPSSGSITIGGVDPHLDDAARRRVAVVFQDFVRYELSLRDNITLGTGEAGDEARALHNAAGDSILERVDGDWDTILATGYENGTDLSGGQWQRVALARAFAASLNGAGILVLDEPTAALDIRAEAELFDRFLNVTEGITSILISHRLSSVRNADRIVVLDSGGVIEDGTHDELLAQQGKYAEMFTIQAQRFTQTGNVDESTEEDTYV